MAYRCTIECTGCGHESGLEERPTGDLNVDALSIGETVNSICFGECDDAVQEHTVVSIGE